MTSVGRRKGKKVKNQDSCWQDQMIERYKRDRNETNEATNDRKTVPTSVKLVILFFSVLIILSGVAPALTSGQQHALSLGVVFTCNI